MVIPDKSLYIYLCLPLWQIRNDGKGSQRKIMRLFSKFIIGIVESTFSENEEFKPRR